MAEQRYDDAEKKNAGRYQRARLADFSPGAVKKAVTRQTLQKPYVLYPGAIGALGIAGSLLIGPLSMFVVPAIVGTAISVGAWLFDSTVRREHHARNYLSSMHTLLVGQLRQTIENLGRDFEELDYPRGNEQLDRLTGKFDTFRQMLERKLDPHELTHGRYLGMTEQVFLAGLDNLKRAANLLQSVSAIDHRRLAERIEALHREDGSDDFKQRELRALESRMVLFDEQIQKAERLLTENEEALTEIDRIMAAIADMNTEKGHASVDMETAMQELKRLAGRAGEYNKID